MKFFGRILVFLAFTCALSRADELEFCGYVSTSGGVLLFGLVDPSDHNVSPWLKIGQHWKGYSVAAFDSHSEELTVEKDTLKRVLKLQSTNIKSPVVLPPFDKGEFVLADGTVIYSHEATLKLGPMMITSPDGVMVSDKSRQIISGDLVIQTSKGMIRVSKGSVRLIDGKIDLTGALDILPISTSSPKLPAPPSEPTPPAGRNSP
jgi:hypothetical protein